MTRALVNNRGNKMVLMKLATFAAATIIVTTSAHVESQVYPRHCTHSDYFPASWWKRTKQRNQLLKVDFNFAIS